MANRIFTQKLIDTQKRAVIKIVVLSDGTNESNTAIIDASQLAYALNANGYIMSSNTHPKSNYRTTIKRAYGQAVSNGCFFISWQGDNKAPILTMSGGIFDYNLETSGYNAVFTNPEANANGMILLSSTNAKNGDSLTLILDLKKDNRDFDAGQTADPDAFKRGY